MGADKSIFIKVHKVKISLWPSQGKAPLRCEGVSALQFRFRVRVHYPGTGNIAYRRQNKLGFFS